MLLIKIEEADDLQVVRLEVHLLTLDRIARFTLKIVRGSDNQPDPIGASCKRGRVIHRDFL